MPRVGHLGCFKTLAVRSTSFAVPAPSSDRLLDGRSLLIQPWEQRPQGTVDQLTGRPVKATNDYLGRELPNVDLRQHFSADDLEAVKQAIDDAGGILVFTNQHPEMTVHDHVRFAQALADSDGRCIEPHAVSAGLPEAAEVLEIVREANADVVFGENWHSDNSFHAETCSYSILRGVEVPRLGVNDTLFSSTEDAYDALSPTMQRLLLDLNAYHSANRAYGRGHGSNSRAAMEKTSTMRFRDDMPILETDVLQPIVSVHPRTGRRGIFVSPTFTTYIDGMRRDESAALLRFLYEWIARPEFCTRVSWHPNQVVMWDNRSLSHKGVADEVCERRVVQRVSIRGTSPMNYNGTQFSLTHKIRAANAGLFE
jgi:taurine dioxygenase